MKLTLLVLSTYTLDETPMYSKCFYEYDDGVCAVLNRFVHVDPNIYVRSLLECRNSRALAEGKTVHGHMVKTGFEPSIYLWNCYAKCGYAENAQCLFDKMHERSIVSWNAMIAAYARCGDQVEAMDLYGQMQWMGTKPDEFTLASVVSPCASMVDLGYGRKIHGPVVKLGFESNVFVGTALVDMYAKCGRVDGAHQMFYLIPVRNIVSWTAMVAGYAQNGQAYEATRFFNQIHQTGYAHNGHYQEALKLSFQMKQIGVKLHQFTYARILSVSSSLPAFEEGKQLHSHIIQTGFDSNMFVESSLVDMYAKFGSLQYARQVLDKMPEQDVISCNAMITRYVQHGYSEEALKLFSQMQQTGLKPDEATFSSIVSACANLAVLEHGRHIHAHIFCMGFESPMSVVNALVTMYAKCGGIKDARKVFEKMTECDVVSWNEMIVGHAQHGDGVETLILFEKMLLIGIRPDAITFLGVLSACSHTGLVDQGHYYFHSVRHEHNITPRTDHHVCMIDLLGCAGL
eukprot:PITA_17920